ncbi:MAG: cold shock domain-containing protein [Alphaproteobacteria bacterium]|nr:cold shock domain-containing protein [Alphaproteobacteria bacterium]
MDKPVSIAPSPESGAIRVTGTVKWFNQDKGYGFVVSGDVDGDILIHRSIIEAYGCHAVLEGTTVEIDVIQKVKGLQARKVYNLDETTAAKGAPNGVAKGNGNGDGKPPRRDIMFHEPTGPVIEAVVKFFSRPKGYGFFVPVGGGLDVFGHMEVLRRCGIRELRQGQKVLIRVIETDKGLSATDVNLLPDVMAAPRPIRMMAPAEFEARP